MPLPKLAGASPSGGGKTQARLEQLLQRKRELLGEV